VRAAGCAALLLGLACASDPGSDSPADPARYRLSASGERWDVAGSDRVLDDVQPRYPEFFAVILDPSRGDEPNLRELRDDLERSPVTRRNYDALNAVAIGYFELNARAERNRGGETYLVDSTRAAKLVAVPWRAYGEVRDPALRAAILDFFEDAASGEKLLSGRTAGRLTRVVASLEPKEEDPARQERIRVIVRRLSETSRR
jgi:hypothetical protein